MTYVVTEACIKCKYMDCVEVCPVDCFYEGENMLVIHPDECIDCGVCEPECPADAIKPDTEPGLEKWLTGQCRLRQELAEHHPEEGAPARRQGIRGRGRQVREVFLPEPGFGRLISVAFGPNLTALRVVNAENQPLIRPVAGRKSLIFAEMCYIGTLSRSPSAHWPRWVPVKPSNRGVAVSTRRQCHRKRVKRVLHRLPRAKKVAGPAVAHPRVGPRLRHRLQSPRRTKEAQCLTRLPNRPRKRPLPSLLAAKAPLAKLRCAKAPVAAAPGKAPSAAKPAVKAAAAAPRSRKRRSTQRQGFKANEFVVYPAHGVGQILAIEEQEIAGAKLELFVINFIKDKMTLRVPTAKVANVGMRKLSEPALVKRALETLKGRARVKRTMWSRRAQEYEAKINSGDIVAIAEVVRDLYPFRVAARAVVLRTSAL